MTVTAIIQARMGSTRFPGKILKKVNGKPLLLHQIERLKRSNLIDALIIATTSSKKDDEVVEFCEKYNLLYYRGSEDNVLERYYKAWKKYGGDIVVRLTSDCPIIDSKIVDETISYFLNNSYDYVSNTLQRTFPRGLDTEVFSSEALKLTYEKANLKSEKEHVTPYIYNNPLLFKIGGYKGSKDYSNYRWTVDTKDDFELISKILGAFEGRENELTLETGIDLMKKYPDWAQINNHVEQKKV